MGEVRRKFHYRKEPLEDTLLWYLGSRTKDGRRIIREVKAWVSVASKAGPDVMKVQVTEEVKKTTGEDLKLLRPMMVLRDSWIWKLRNAKATPTLTNQRIARRMEQFPSAQWNRLGAALYDAAEAAIQKWDEERYQEREAERRRKQRRGE